VRHAEGIVVVDRWLPLRVPPKTAVLLRQLRQELERCLKAAAENPAQARSDPGTMKVSVSNLENKKLKLGELVRSENDEMYSSAKCYPALDFTNHFTISYFQCTLKIVMHTFYPLYFFPHSIGC